MITLILQEQVKLKVECMMNKIKFVSCFNDYYLNTIAIYLFGGEILKGFSFAMIIGVFIGTYSSIFVAAPLLNYTKVTQKTVSKEDN